MVTSHAFADCYNFVNGNGPQQIGNVQLYGTAGKVCVLPSELQFYVQGGLVYAEILSASQSRSGDQAQYTLGRVEVNNQLFNATSAVVTIQTSSNNHLGLAQGVLTIQAGRGFPEKYLIMKASSESDWNH